MTISLFVGGTSANTFTGATIKNISLQQDVGVVNEVLPIDVLTVDVLATSITLYNNWVELTVDSALWCVYWLTDLRKTGVNTYRIVAKSPVVLLDTAVVPANMYVSSNAYMVFEALLSPYIPVLSLDANLSSIAISGYCPQQTVRERVQWLLMSLPGAFRLRTSFLRGAAIEPVGYGGTIANGIVYLAPTLTQETVVTSFRTAYHAYEVVGGPDAAPDVIQFGGYYYAHTVYSLQVTNMRPEVSFAAYNELGVSDVTTLNSSNAAPVTSILSAYYFNYSSVWRGRFMWFSGMRLGSTYTIPVTPTTTAVGYLRSAKYIFGNQGIAVDAEFTCQR